MRCLVIWNILENLYSVIWTITLAENEGWTALFEYISSPSLRKSRSAYCVIWEKKTFFIMFWFVLFWENEIPRRRNIVQIKIHRVPWWERLGKSGKVLQKHMKVPISINFGIFFTDINYLIWLLIWLLIVLIDFVIIFHSLKRSSRPWVIYVCIIIFFIHYVFLLSWINILLLLFLVSHFHKVILGAYAKFRTNRLNGLLPYLCYID